MSFQRRRITPYEPKVGIRDETSGKWICDHRGLLWFNDEEQALRFLRRQWGAEAPASLVPRHLLPGEYEWLNEGASTNN